MDDLIKINGQYSLFVKTIIWSKGLFCLYIHILLLLFLIKIQKYLQFCRARLKFIDLAMICDSI